MLTIGIEVHNIVSVDMTIQIKVLLNSFGLLNKFITYVKDERSNLVTLNFALIFVISYFPF
jgi:hypothetical protein